MMTIGHIIVAVLNKNIHFFEIMKQLIELPMIYPSSHNFRWLKHVKSQCSLAKSINILRTFVKSQSLVDDKTLSKLRS